MFKSFLSIFSRKITSLTKDESLREDIPKKDAYFWEQKLGLILSLYPYLRSAIIRFPFDFYMSCVKCHNVYIYIFFVLEKAVKLIGGGFFINGAYPV